MLGKIMMSAPLCIAVTLAAVALIGTGPARPDPSPDRDRPKVRYRVRPPSARQAVGVRPDQRRKARVKAPASE